MAIAIRSITAKRRIKNEPGFQIVIFEKCFLTYGNYMCVNVLAKRVEWSAVASIVFSVGGERAIRKISIEE